jgi:hypothetical protein
LRDATSGVNDKAINNGARMVGLISSITFAKTLWSRSGRNLTES